jgi:hypothetical protein
MEDFASRSHGCARTIFTIGHSTRTFAELIALLREARIELLVDVRSVPRSRTNPQFNIDILPEALAAAGVGYRHLPSLGGWRPTVRTRCLPLIRFGGTHHFGIMPTTRGLKRSGWEWRNWKHCLATSVAPSCAPKPCGGVGFFLPIGARQPELMMP